MKKADEVLLESWQKPSFPVNDLLVTMTKDQPFPTIKFLTADEICELANKYDVMDAITKIQNFKERMDVTLEKLKEEYLQSRMTEKSLFSTMASVNHLQKEKEEKKDLIKFDYQLSHGIYAQAEIPPPDNVRIWIGSSVLMQLSLDEAEELLQEQLDLLKTKLEETQKSIDFLRDNIVHLEVNHSRFNLLWEQRVRQVKATLLSERQQLSSSV